MGNPLWLPRCAVDGELRTTGWRLILEGKGRVTGIVTLELDVKSETRYHDRPAITVVSGIRNVLQID